MDTPLSETLEDKELSEFYEWLHHFTQNMCAVLDFMHSHEIIEAELEWTAEEMTLQDGTLESNIVCIKDALAHKNED